MTLTKKPVEHLTVEAMGGAAIRMMLPRPQITVAEYAEKHRYLPSGTGRGDRWRNSKTPYLVEPMEMLDSQPLHNTVCIAGPGQVAKTVSGENWLLKSVAEDPANFLWYMQNDASLEAYVKDRINPMIDDHEEMLGAKGPRPIDDSLHYKRFRGMSAQFLTATHGNLINKNAPRIVADEIDAWVMRGDVKPLIDIRRQAFQDRSMLLAISHPDRARGLLPERDWTEGVMAIYADSTRCMWFWKCPHCGAYSSPCPLASRVMVLAYPNDGTLDEIETGAYLLCPVNGCIIKNSMREAMNLTGVWIGEGQQIDKEGRIKGTRIARKTAGYWIQGVMSPFVLGGIGALARARAKAERERDQTGEDGALRQVIVKQWGIPYAPMREVGSITAQDLASRVEPELRLGEVPEGVRFITIGVDIQLAYFEYLVRGWGERGESWVISRGKKLAETATSADDWDWLLELFGKEWPLADGSGRTMVARGAGFDTGGAAGVAQQAYSAFTRWRSKQKVRLNGQIAGREVWSIMPLKGANTLNAPRLNTTYPDTSRKANKLAGRGDVPVGMFNPNLFKDDLAGQLMKGDAGSWYIHFPHALLSKEPPHVFFEQAVSETRRPNGRWEKLVPSARNEVLDLLVMTHVLAHLHGPTRINWSRPPGWAAPWDKNTLVQAAKVVDAKGEPVAPERPKGGAVKVTVDQSSKKTIGKRIA